MKEGMSYPMQEHPSGSVGPDEVLKTGDVLIKVSGMVAWVDPRSELITYQNREGGRYREGWGWGHLRRQGAPFALFRPDRQPEAVAYLCELRTRAAAELRERAARLEAGREHPLGLRRRP